MKTLWDMNVLVSSYWGMYAVQTVLHSVIASVLVECAFLAWNMRTPYVKQWFRFMVILLPVASFPLYQLMVPNRGDMFFRLRTLMDSNKWFFLEIWGGITVFTVFMVVLVLTSLIFFIQELVPILIHMAEQVRGGSEPVAEAVEETIERKVSLALEALPIDRESVDILNDDDLALFSSTGLHPRIYVSTGLIKSFSVDHLQVAFAHEVGHIQRSRKPVLIFTYIIRVLMFYNPVAMIEFRRIAQEEEKVCDDIALALTGKPKALSEAIEMLRPEPEEYSEGGVRGVTSALEQYGHDVLLRSRVLRIAEGSEGAPRWGVPYFVALTLIISINYFVV